MEAAEEAAEKAAEGTHLERAARVIDERVPRRPVAQVRVQHGWRGRSRGRR